MAVTAIHPYYPEAVILSGTTFVENNWDVASLISAFAAGWALILGVTLTVVRKVNPGLKALDQGLVLWFVLSMASEHLDEIDLMCW